MPPDGKVPCEFCGKMIKETASRCRYCGEYVDDDTDDRDHGREAARWLVPIDRSAWAILAGYLGLFSCFPFIGIVAGLGAIVTGILALKELGRKRKIGGRGRAIFGIIMGVIGVIVWGFFTAILLTSPK